MASLAALVAACRPSRGSGSAEAHAASAPPAPAQPDGGVDATPKVAAVGRLAPDFTLTDVGGTKVSLGQFRGKVVVLEWWNPECPFVNAAHTKGSLKTAAADATAHGVVWLAINSNAPGKQGSLPEANAEAQTRFGLHHPVLLDPTGAVGQMYGATNTPHMFVIDERGVLVYRGAVDNSPDGEGESPTSGRLVRYVDAALADLRAGRPVAVQESPAYGCSVKYATR